MTALPASPFQPYTLYVYHKEMPDGVACVCGLAEGDLLRQTASTGLPGLNEAMFKAEADVDDDTNCAGWYEAAGLAGFTRSYP